MAKISTLKTAVKTATKVAKDETFDELLQRQFKPKSRTEAEPPPVPKPSGKPSGGKLSEPKAAGNTVVIAGDSTQPGSGEIRRMVEAGESLPTDLKGLVKVSDAIRAGASASAVKPFILSMGNKRKKEALASGGYVHRRLKGTGFDGANRKGQFQKGRGKVKAGNADESSDPQATGEDYVSKKRSNASMKSPDELAAERGEAPATRLIRKSVTPPEPTEPAKFKPGTKELPPAFGTKRGVAAPKEEGGAGGMVGKMAGKVAGKLAGKAVGALKEKVFSKVPKTDTAAAAASSGPLAAVVDKIVATDRKFRKPQSTDTRIRAGELRLRDVKAAFKAGSYAQAIKLAFADDDVWYSEAEQQKAQEFLEGSLR